LLIANGMASVSYRGIHSPQATSQSPARCLIGSQQSKRPVRARSRWRGFSGEAR